MEGAQRQILGKRDIARLTTGVARRRRRAAAIEITVDGLGTAGEIEVVAADRMNARERLAAEARAQDYALDDETLLKLENAKRLISSTFAPECMTITNSSVALPKPTDTVVEDSKEDDIRFFETVGPTLSKPLLDAIKTIALIPGVTSNMNPKSLVAAVSWLHANGYLNGDHQAELMQALSTKTGFKSDECNDVIFATYAVFAYNAMRGVYGDVDVIGGGDGDDGGLGDLILDD